MGKTEVEKIFGKDIEIVQCCRNYVLETFRLVEKKRQEKILPTEEMVYGCLKLLNEMLNVKVFVEDYECIFIYLVETYIEAKFP